MAAARELHRFVLNPREQPDDFHLQPGNHLERDGFHLAPLRGEGARKAKCAGEARDQRHEAVDHRADDGKRPENARRAPAIGLAGGVEMCRNARG